jgi:hypothetical protein
MLGEFPVEHGPKEANTAVNPDVSAGVKTSADSPGAALATHSPHRSAMHTWRGNAARQNHPDDSRASVGAGAPPWAG